jgi:hypothetical protein
LQKSNYVKRVYLGLSYHNLSSSYDDWTYGKEKFDFPSSYFYMLPLCEKLKLIFWNREHLMFFLKNTFSKGFVSIVKRPTYLGPEENENRNRLKALQEKIDEKISFFYGHRTVLFSQLNLLYLQKIKELLERKKIELVFVNTPLHPYYYSKIPEVFITKYDSIINASKLKVVDFSNLNLVNDNYFTPDGEHVNADGAYIVTQEVKKLKL